MQNNILVQYQGGGYDGCIWEWNFFYINKDGGFEDVFSSGSMGITNKEDGQALFDKDTDDVYVYHMDNKEDLKSFATETNSILVKTIVDWFNVNNEPHAEPFAICDECGCEITDAVEIRLENWHGCGGIMSTADKLLCYECYGYGVCGCCDEYVGTDDITYLGGEYDFDDEYKNKATREMLDDGYSDVCSGCIDWQAEQIETDEKEDLIWQSLATGKPDMFSDEMRWLWI